MNLPNSISIFRMCLIPVFVGVFFSPMKNAEIYAVLIFILAGVSDVVDGYIARKYDLVTRLGRIIDPLADKLMVVAALFCVAISGKIHIIFPILYVVKELYQVYGAYKLMDKISDVPPANFWGKAGTCLFYLTIVVSIVFKNVPSIIVTVLIILSFASSITALVSYYIRGKKLINQANEREES